MTDPYPQPIYFIGIALPSELDRQVSELQWRFREGDKHLLKPLLPHVTLLHPPSLRGIMPEEFLPRVREVATRYLPLTLAVKEVGFFGRSVCYLRIQSHGLDSLQSQLVRLLPPDARAIHYKRPYTAHITLAQAYEPHPLDIEAMRRTISTAIELPQQFTVDSVTYFKRILPREYRAEVV